MARSHMRYIVRDRGGNAIANALVRVYLKGTSTPVSDMYAAESGGAAVTTLTTNVTGEIEAWMDTPKFVDLTITDNSNAAYNPGAVGTLDFSDQTETVEVVPRPEEVPTLGGTQTWTGTQTFAAVRGTTARFSLEPHANVKHPTYGALGDGANDDTAEIQAALTAAKEVLIPDGTYMISAALTPVSGSRIVLSKNAVLKFTAAATGGIPIFHLNGVTDVTIEGGVLDGNKAANPTPTSGLYGVMVEGLAARIRLNGIHARNFPSSSLTGANGGDGFYIGRSGTDYPSQIWMSDCSVADCVRQGISVTAGRRVHIENFSVTGITGSTGGNGINLEPTSPHPVEDITIVAPHVWSCSKGIQIGNNVGGHVKIVNPVIHTITDATNGHGIDVGSATGVVTIDNPTIEATVLDGISLGTAASVNINGGSIKNADRYGIRMQGPRQQATGVSVEADVDNCIRLENSAVNCRVVGCSFYITGNFGAVRSDNTTDHLIAANQFFSTGTGTAIRIGAPASNGTGHLVVANRAEGFATGLEMLANTSLNRAYSNDFTGCTATVSDTGTNNVVVGSHGVTGEFRIGAKALVTGELELDGAFNHDGTSFGTGGVAPATVPASATSDLKDLLVSLGFLTDGGATPLNLDAGTLTAGVLAGTHNIAKFGTSSIADANATPDVSNATVFSTQNSGATTITNFTNGVSGQVIIVKVDANTTVQNNANIKLAGAANFTGSADDTLTLVNISAVWYEVSRSVN